MLQVADIQIIKRLFYGKRWSRRRIARELGMSRRTVNRVLAGKSTGGYQKRKARGRPVTSQIEPVIRGLLEKERSAETPRKQRLTAVRIEKILRKEHGFSGGEASVRRAVARVRVSLCDVPSTAMVPLVYEPGIDGQVDFLEADVDYPDGRRRLHFLLVRPCYSTRPFVYHAPAENQVAFLEGMEEAFQAFGGVLHRLWFDNLTPAVKRVLDGWMREPTGRFAAFQAHYGFEAAFCSVGKGNEKGGVENGVGYLRRHALSPIPNVSGDEDLAEILAAWMAEEMGRQPAGRSATIGQMWSEETPSLMPLPATPFAGWPTDTRKVSAFSLISYERNLYSVPVELVGQRLMVKLRARTVEIFSQDRMVAEHRRFYGRGHASFNLQHYLPLLERKVRAFDRAAPVVAARRSWPPGYERLLRVLRTCEGEADGTRSFIEVLRLHASHQDTDLHAAVEQTLEHQVPSVALVRSYLDAIERINSPRASLDSASLSVPLLEVVAPDPSVYDQLRIVEGGQ